MTTILFICYLFFGRVLSWSLAVSLTLILGRRTQVGGTFILVGLMGLLEDIVGVRSLGGGAAVLVSLLFITWLVNSQYSNRAVWWWVLLGAVGEMTLRLVEGRPISVVAGVSQVICLLVIHWFYRRWQQQEGIYVG